MMVKKFVLIFCVLMILPKIAFAEFSLKVLLKVPYLTSYFDSLGHEVKDSLVRNREVEVIIYRSGFVDSLSQLSTTNDSGIVSFSFNYWSDQMPVDTSNINRIDLNFPNSCEVIREGENVEFIPLRSDSIDFSQWPEEINIVLPMSVSWKIFNIGAGFPCFGFAIIALEVD